MQRLTPLTAPADLAGAWCNDDDRTSATLEAVSFVTPALERFFIRTVADCLPLEGNDPELERLCREFIHEEAEHTGAHRKLNTALLDYMKAPPPGLAAVEGLLDIVNRRLSLSTRVALVAALEHFTAVLSKSYLCSHGHWQFGCAYARDLFHQHAHEEIDHRSVAFDLWLHRGGGSVPVRMATITSILMVGAVYLGIAAPWILHRKNGGRFAATIAALLTPRPRPAGAGSTFKDLLRYVGRNYHPRHLIDDLPNPEGSSQ
ncbi:MAG: metal-dependent hydrolase [Rhodocyclales bacterium]|nr:metal-dependent hydrolase [Rhodocyclales bacterium]MBI5783929.1 metal-dependent hydrolase [Rhodocyclales bacterium]